MHTEVLHTTLHGGEGQVGVACWRNRNRWAWHVKKNTEAGGILKYNKLWVWQVGVACQGGVVEIL